VGTGKASTAVVPEAQASCTNQVMRDEQGLLAKCGNFRMVSIADERASESSASQSDCTMT